MSAAAESSWTPPDAKAEATADLRPLFEQAGVGAAKFQRSGKIIILNPTLERWLGASSEMKPGAALCVGDVFPAEDCGESERCLRELFDGKRDSFRMDTTTAGAPSQSFSVPLRSVSLHWTVWRVAGNDGETDYALAIAEEAATSEEAAGGVAKTESKIEQRLRQSEKLEAVGRLAGAVAHDFNNVLTGVLLYCDLLLGSIEAGPRVRKYAEEIRSAGLQATGLVRQLLAVSRPKAMDSGLLSLNEIVAGMRSLLTRLIGENIGLKFQLDPGLGLVRMDATEAQQILLNLVLNARDAMAGGGEISVETSNCRVQIVGADGGSPRAVDAHSDDSQTGSSPASLPCALFVVGDNGRGMEAETRAHLFEAFYTTKSDGRGTGLGLATVYEIVTSNGGLIHVASAPGCGARVSVLLPLVPAEVSKSQPADEVANGNERGGNSLLEGK
jgi:signal transduction histidine kinase